MGTFRLSVYRIHFVPYLTLTFNAFHAKFGVFFKLLLLEANGKELIIPVSFETLEIFINIV